MRKKLFARYHTFALRFFLISFFFAILGGYIVSFQKKLPRGSLETFKTKESDIPFAARSPVLPLPKALISKPVLRNDPGGLLEERKQVEQVGEKAKAEDALSVSLIINQNKYALAIPIKSSVYEAMKKAQDTTTFRFSGKEFSGMGFFVEEIDGVKNDYRGGRYWIYYVNDKKASVGISNYILNAGDTISWKYEVNEG